MEDDQEPRRCALCGNRIEHPDGPALETINGQACLSCAHNLHVFTFGYFLVADTHRFTVSVAPVTSDHVSMGDRLVAIGETEPPALTDDEHDIVETLARWETPTDWAEVDVTDFDQEKYEQVTPELRQTGLGDTEFDRALANQLPKPVLCTSGTVWIPPSSEPPIRDALEPTQTEKSTQGALTEF